MAINGFSTCDERVLGVFLVPGTRRAVRIRREVAPLLLGFASEFHRYVEDIDNGILDDWGYACRSVRGANVASFHAAGIALDLNATRHPLGRRGTFSARQATIIRALCRKYGLRWGGDYRVRADEMHVEVIRQRADALALVRALQTPPADPNPTLYRGMPGQPRQAIKNWQNGLNLLGNRLRLDGEFGAETERITGVFQRNRPPLRVDGRVTTDDWFAMRKAIAGRR